MGARGSVAVVGGGLGGLSAAIHLALEGFDVALFESGERVGGRANLIARDGYRFDTGPTLLNYPWVFRDLFRAAGRRLDDVVDLLPVDPTVTFRWPGGESLTLSSDLRRLLDECERVEPGGRPAMLAFLRDAERKYRIAFERLAVRNASSAIGWLSGASARELLATGVWRSLDRELARFFSGKILREALGSYAMYLGGSPHALPGIFSILPYGEISRGLWLPRGGIHALVDAIERLARDLGVDISTSRRVRRISVSRGRANGVEVEGEGRFEADAVVSNVDVPTTDLRLLGPGALPARALRRSERLRMTPGVTTFYWGFAEKIAGLDHHTVCLPGDARGAYRELFSGAIPRELPFYVSAPAATDATVAPAGHTALFVLVPTPLLSAMPEADWTEVAASLRERVRGRLRAEGTDLDGLPVAFEATLTTSDWAGRFGLHDGSAFGAAHGFFQLGPYRPPNRSAEIEGLFYTGASTVPGTGLPLVTLGGGMTARRVASWRAGARR